MNNNKSILDHIKLYVYSWFLSHSYTFVTFYVLYFTPMTPKFSLALLIRQTPFFDSSRDSWN